MLTDMFFIYSQQFGFLRLNDPENSGKKLVVQKVSCVYDAYAHWLL